MGQLFNILVCRFCFLCVYHMDVVIFYGLSGVSFHLICVKDHDQRTFFIALVIAQNVHEPVSGAVDVHLCQLA